MIKVNNFDKMAENSLDEWIYFLKTSEIPECFHAKGLEEAKKHMRIDNLSKAEKEEYEIWIKTERIRESEIKSALTDGYYKAKNELLPIIEEERKIAEQERKKANEERKKADEERKKADEERKKADEERKKADEAQYTITKLILKQYKKGISIAEIAEDMELNKSDVEKIIQENQIT